jgi:hypothetical protein
MESATNDVLSRYNKAQVDSYIAIRDAQLMLLQSKVNRAESVSTQTLVQKMKENGVPQDVAEALAKLVTD